MTPIILENTPAAPVRPASAAAMPPRSQPLWPWLVVPIAFCLLLGGVATFALLNRPSKQKDAVAEEDAPADKETDSSPPTVTNSMPRTEANSTPRTETNLPLRQRHPAPAKLALREVFHPRDKTKAPDLELAADRPAPKLLASAPFKPLPNLTQTKLLTPAGKIPKLSRQQQALHNLIVSRFIAYDIGRLRGLPGQIALTNFNQLGQEALPALISGLNQVANIRASCPIVVLAQKIKTILTTTQDLALVSFAQENIGKNIRGARYQYVLTDLQKFCDSRLSNWKDNVRQRLPQLVEALRNTDAAVRRNAANTLGSLGADAKEAVPALAERLKDSDAEVGGYAARALVEIGAPAVSALIEALEDSEARLLALTALAEIRPAADATVAAFIKALQDRDAEVYSAAHHALVKLGPAALPALEQALQKKAVRSRAALVLGYIGAPAAKVIPKLAAALNDKDKDFRVAAHHALVQMGRPAVPELCQALKDPEDRVWYSAAIALGKIGPAAEDALPALRAALKDKNLGLRVLAVDAIMKIDPSSKAIQAHLDEAVPALIEVLDVADPTIRAWAIVCLGKLGAAARPAVPALVRALRAKDAAVRSRAAEALGNLGDGAKDAIRDLVTVLKDPNEEVGRAAGSALEKFGRTALPALIAAQKDKPARLRCRVAGIFKNLGKEARNAVPILIEVRADADPQVRLMALHALEKIDPADTKVMQSFLTGLKDNQENIGQAARQALVKLGRTAVPLLIASLKEEEVRSRVALAGTLQKIGAEAEDAVPDLITVAKEADTKVRQSALEALGGISPALPEVLQCFVNACKDPEKQVRRAAQRGLHKAGAKAVAVLAEALRQEDAGFRCTVAETLKDFGPKGRASVAALLAISRDMDRKVRLQVANALIEIDPAAPAVMRDFIAGLNDADEEVRIAAHLGLVKAGKAAIPLLAAALDHKEAVIRRGAIETIKKIRTEGHAGKEILASVPFLFRALKDADKEVCDGASWALGEIDPELKAALPALTKAVKSPPKMAGPEAVILEKDLRLVSTARLIGAATREEGKKLQAVLKELAERRGEGVLVVLALATTTQDKETWTLARKLLFQYLANKPSAFDEQRAAARLTLYKRLAEEGKAKKAYQRLEDLVREQPRTRAAEEARQMLAEKHK